MKLLSFAILLLSLASAPAADPALKIAVSATAPPIVQAAAARVLQATPQHPLLSILASGGKPALVADTQALLSGPLNDRALTNLIVIGLSDDPMVKACSQREARFDKGGTVYVFGFGYFQGDVGIVESERNPFLYSPSVAKAPYSAHILVLTGSTPAGVALAVDAFLRHGIINGVAVAQGFRRPKPCLMEAAPWTPAFRTPTGIVPPSSSWKPIGITLMGGPELSGALEEGGELPIGGMRLKYWRAGAWTGAGSDFSFRHFSTGLHRRSAGNCIAIFQYATPIAAAKAAPGMALAAKLGAKGPNRWYKEGDNVLLGAGIWQQNLTINGSSLVFSNFQK